MKIAVAGTGYVGVSLATLLSQNNEVVAIDVIPEKVEKINNRISPIKDEYIEKYFKEKNIEINLKYIDPSYQVRASVTTAADSIYCERLGNNAVHAAMAGKTKLVIGLVHDKFVHLPIKMVTKHRNAVDPEGSLWRDALDATGQPIHMINDMEKARSKMAEAIAEAKRKPSEQKK